MIEAVRASRLRCIRLVVAALTTLFGVAVVPPAARAGEELFASVGTGELNGVYYPVGKAICDIANRRSEHRWRTLLARRQRRDRSTIYTPSSPASWSSASFSPTSNSMLTRAKALGSANRFSICDPCYRCILNSSRSLLARTRIFKILRTWRGGGSILAAAAPAPGRPGTRLKRNSAGATKNGCVRWS